jgi:hypothetical protein
MSIENMIFKAGDACAYLGERTGVTLKRASSKTIVYMVGILFLLEK